LLLLAAQYTFQFRREDLNDDDGERLRLEQQEFAETTTLIADDIESTEPDDKSLTAEEIAEPYIDVTSKPKAQSKSIESSEELKDIPDTANRMFYQEEIIDQPKKKT
jgi:hypothetical protein